MRRVQSSAPFGTLNRSGLVRGCQGILVPPTEGFHVQARIWGPHSATAFSVNAT
jgi:hypothetical protein